MVATKSQLKETVSLLSRRSKETVDKLYNKFNSEGLNSEELTELRLAEQTLAMWNKVSKQYQ